MPQAIAHLINAAKLPTFPPDRVALLPDVIAPSMIGAWGAVCFLTDQVPAAQRDLMWLNIRNKVAPGKLQYDFTPEDWQKVIDILRNEPHHNTHTQN